MAANLVWLGIALEIISTMSGTVGKQLIRYSELTKFKNPKVSKTSFYVGLVVNTICGPAIDMAAYSFAPQSLIAPFGGLDVVWNALSAPYLLQEKLTFRRAMGCLLICMGTATAGAVGSQTDPVYTIDYLEDLILTPRIPIYFSVFFIWFLVNVCIFQKRAKGNPIRGVSLGMTAGTIAGNMFCVKSSVEIIQYSINEDTAEPWRRWLTYVMLLGAAFFAISNVKYMTRGLQEFEALFMVTVYEGSMIVSGCVSGSIVLLDLRDLEVWRIVVYWLSVVVIVFGMCVVFSNEMMNMSSLAAGTASIKKDCMKELQLKPSVTVGVAGVGSAGISATKVEAASPSSRRSPKSLADPADGGSPFMLSLGSPSNRVGGGSPSPFFPAGMPELPDLESKSKSTPEHPTNHIINIDTGISVHRNTSNVVHGNGLEASPLGRRTSAEESEEARERTPLKCQL